MLRSNSIRSNDKGGGHPADIIINKVFEIHRKSHHFSIRKTQPKIYEKIKEEVKSASRKSLEEAFIAFKASAEKAGKAPHPNYFLKVVQRLEKELDNKGQEPYINGNLNLGKSI